VNANSLEITVDPRADPYETAEPGTCAVQVFDNDRTVITGPSVSRPKFLDAGAVVRLTGPSYSVDLPRTPGSTYGTNLPNGTFGTGVWTFSSSGGADIAAFQLAVELPEALSWTNRQDIIDPKQPLRIEWSNGGAAPVDIVVTASNSGGFASVICTSRIEDRTITIPAALISMLPSGGSGGIILTQAVTKTGFTVPLTGGGMVDGSLLRIIYQTSGSIRVQ